MEELIVNGATVGAIAALLCTASITHNIREWLRPYTTVLDCPFCTSFWLALVVDHSPTYFATVCFGNIAIMLIHWSMATHQTQEDQT